MAPGTQPAPTGPYMQAGGCAALKPKTGTGAHIRTPLPAPPGRPARSPPVVASRSLFLLMNKYLYLLRLAPAGRSVVRVSRGHSARPADGMVLTHWVPCGRVDARGSRAAFHTPRALVSRPLPHPGMPAGGGGPGLACRRTRQSVPGTRLPAVLSTPLALHPASSCQYRPSPQTMHAACELKRPFISKQ